MQHCQDPCQGLEHISYAEAEAAAAKAAKEAKARTSRSSCNIASRSNCIYHRLPLLQALFAMF
eukprot:2170667-Amphidinium_carterae.1